MNAIVQRDPAEIVERLRNWIRQGKSDHWLGMQARLMIAPDSAPDAARRRTDNPGTGDWIDTGSQAGYDAGTAWERHDDPRA